MKKQIKLVAVLLVSILMIATLTACTIDKSKQNANANQFTKSWMSYVNDLALVKNIAIAGSNDSALYNTASFAKTQHFSVAQQLTFGVRYFEINVRLKGDVLYAFYGSYLGERIDDILDAVKNFLKNYPTETVILDFAGFNNQPQEALIASIDKYLAVSSYKYIVRKTITSSLDEDFINNLTLSNARGKAIVFMDGDGNEYLDKQYIFKRNDSNGNRIYSALQSYYDKDANKMSSQDYVASLPNYVAKYKASNQGFFVLQGQLHDGPSLQGPAYYESQHQQNMSNYIINMDADTVDTINVITRNFIDCTKVCQIIALNVQKNNLKPATLEEFKTNLTEFIG